MLIEEYGCVTEGGVVGAEHSERILPHIGDIFVTVCVQTHEQQDTGTTLSHTSQCC